MKQKMSNFADLMSRTEKLLTSPSKPVSQSTPAKPSGSMIPNIKDVVVPDSFLNKIIESTTDKKQTVNVESVPNESPISPLEEKITDLISRLTLLLKEAKEIMNEMTTVGMIGTNQKFTFKKKKNGPAKNNKRN